MNEGRQAIVKCVIWDLDDTIWTGTLSEDSKVVLKEGIIRTLKGLDERGILQSVSSKNNHDDAFAMLREFGIEEYFLRPQISWDAKSSHISKIAEVLNISVDTMLFVDDQIIERDEVQSAHPSIGVASSANSGAIQDLLGEDAPRVTSDARSRRLKYMEEFKRNDDEEKFVGPKTEFIAGLGMKLRVRVAEQSDLDRAEELTVRTNQLNATGITYTKAELEHFIESDDYRLLVCELTDKYGSYGIVGIALLEVANRTCHVKLVLMSCRVLNRGLGSILLEWIARECQSGGLRLTADFRDTGRNKMMQIAFMLSSFKFVKYLSDDRAIYERDSSVAVNIPDYLELDVDDLCLPAREPLLQAD